MCREFVVSHTNEQIAQHFSLSETSAIEPSFSVRRGRDIATIHETKSSTSSTRIVQPLRWGLVPHWMNEDLRERRIFNARAETLHQKPAFREGFAERRCIVPASGFFEWTTQVNADGDGERVPLYLEEKNGAPLGFAALYDEWYSREGELVRSCAIVTTESNRLLRLNHARMPAILRADDYAQWLDPHNFDVKSLRSMLQPFDAKKMALRFLSNDAIKKDASDATRIESAETIEYSKLKTAPKKRLVLRDWQSPEGQVFFETRSFTRDDYTWWHPVVDLESGSVWCDCPDFRFRHAPHEPSIASPGHWCKHVARAVNNCRRHGELRV